MAQRWQLQEAKNKFSQVVNEAAEDGPQIITRHGVDVAVVISAEEYRCMVTRRGKLSEFFRGSPLARADLDLTRDKSDARKGLEL